MKDKKEYWGILMEKQKFEAILMLLVPQVVHPVSYTHLLCLP